MAAVAGRVAFIPGILVLPQRQTALAAKQAAELDVLSEGRLRLGWESGGTRWNLRLWEKIFTTGENGLRNR